MVMRMIRSDKNIVSILLEYDQNIIRILELQLNIRILLQFNNISRILIESDGGSRNFETVYMVMRMIRSDKNIV